MRVIDHHPIIQTIVNLSHVARNALRDKAIAATVSVNATGATREKLANEMLTNAMKEYMTVSRDALIPRDPTSALVMKATILFLQILAFVSPSVVNSVVSPAKDNAFKVYVNVRKGLQEWRVKRMWTSVVKIATVANTAV